MTYGIVKALHIIAFTCWFAGLFYLVRLFIYHVEADELEPVVKNAFKPLKGAPNKNRKSSERISPPLFTNK